ncbi:arabinan endo-1,5-alpha-L-arabinosidase [Saccharothrix ecbatanensis]|uniref:Arabinan endo-1,5-alpha-L-arabinosidase n=1 Tax=Saccharothrix ecbatanensis TaxID=1105145 RepID=A0A7W9M167_9PSEU|nr:family 43 glycosylhydrolase [Saccharothrix ecbatanensis]MBB5803502.1 arabinan endo-1,5-alpha-L-arabinosidase [Saccharothrix ecbatanensis]
MSTIRRRLTARLRAVVLALGVGALLTTVPTAARADLAGDVGPMHDPTIARSGDCYYVVSSLDGFPIRRSCTGLDGPWSVIGKVFPDGSPSWLKSYLNTTDPKFEWAPSIDQVNGVWRVYYAGTTYGSQTSAIGLATATNIEGPWTDQGEVLRSRARMAYNAIDPDTAWTVVNGKRVTPYLVWGSWWTGLYIRQLGTDGKFAPNTPEVHIASRPNGAIEAASIVHRDGYYHLFASFDICCKGANSSYRVMYGRSRSITGPYLDRNGVDMLDGGGTQLIASYGNVRGPGHQDVFDDNGTFRIVHHYYDSTRDTGPFDAHMQIRDLAWTSDGWPQLLGPSTELGGTGKAIVNQHSRLCLDDWEWNTTPGATVRMYTCNGSNAQQWHVSNPGASNNGYATIVNRHSGLCLDNWEGDTTPGAPVAQYTCNRLHTQDHRLEDVGDGWFRIRNRHNNLCLDNWEWNTSPGAEVRWHTCNDHAVQRWRIS